MPRRVIGGIFSAIIPVLGIGAGYAYSTKFKDQITIKDKYYTTVNYPKNGITRTICNICDNQGRHFKVDQNLWFWKFNSTNLWSSLDEGGTYNIEGYGLRFDPLRIYPNIISVDKVEPDHRKT